jgi:tetratricopeptide (TPR) repeat protein
MLSLLLALQLVTPPTPDVRLNTLDGWLQAVAQHEPGTADAPVLRVREMNRLGLDWVRRDLRTVLTLMRDPKASVFYDEPNPRFPHRPPGVLVYGRVELEALRQFATRARALGNRNDVLKRGALLHTDTAMLAPADGRPAEGRLDGQLSVQLDDARQFGLRDVISHFEVARQLLDLITTNPDKNEPAHPASDEDVRLWYVATAAFMIGYQKFDLGHFPRASQLFPSDPDIQFMVGGFHASMAAPRWQIGLQRADLRGFEIGVESRRDELRLAETALRRAAASGPNVPEARLRLGRVLGMQGRAVDATRELRVALPQLTNPLLLYYVELFLGRELETLNQFAAARAAYQHAADLYPRAQSPRIALSQLSVRAGNRAVALTEARQAFGAVDDLDDPWWSYEVSAGRAADILLEQMRKALSGQR